MDFGMAIIALKRGAACKNFIWEKCECSVLAEYGVCKKFERRKKNDR